MTEHYGNELKAGRSKVSYSTNKGGEFAAISIDIPTDSDTKEVREKFDELWQLLCKMNKPATKSLSTHGSVSYYP